MDAHTETLSTPMGELTFWFKLHTPSPPAPELPYPPYIFLDHIAANPRGLRLLRRYAPEMIRRIRSTLRSERTIILQPASGKPGDLQAQQKLEAYYRSCGFDYLPTSKTKFWMTWPKTT